MTQEEKDEEEEEKVKDITDAAPIASPSFSEIVDSLDKRLFKEKKPPSPPPLPKEEMVASEGVTISSGTTNTIPEDGCNLIVVSSNNQNDRAKTNTSTITIISDLPDPSNSLASNISQVILIPNSDYGAIFIAYSTGYCSHYSSTSFGGQYQMRLAFLNIAKQQ